MLVFSTDGLYTEGLYTDGLYTDGLYTDGLYTDGLYTDGLYTDGIKKMNGLGCHMGSRFTGALDYDDDITLLAPCKLTLSIPVSVCEKYASEFDIADCVQ